MTMQSSGGRVSAWMGRRTERPATADELTDAREAAPEPDAGDVTPAAPATIEQPDTPALVRRARAGDREAFEMLFRRYHDEIYRFATRRVGDPISGQDIAAETFAAAFRSIGRFQFQGAPFEAWLYTIARRRVADHVRAGSRAQIGVIEQEPPVAGHEPGVVDGVFLRSLVARLPDSERDVIELRFMEDLNVEQTAARLGKNPGAVRVAQHRGLLRLRTLMAEARR